MSEILDAVHQTLVEAGTPLHFDELFKRVNKIVPLGTGEAAENKFYGKIYHDIKKYGEMSRFIKLPKAHFVARANFNPATMEVGKANKTITNPAGKKIGPPAIPQTCGNCRFIEYNGMQQVSLATGVCGLHQESGRLGVQSREAGCERWVRRSEAQRERDRLDQVELQAHVDGVNLACLIRGGRRG